MPKFFSMDLSIEIAKGWDNDSNIFSNASDPYLEAIVNEIKELSGRQIYDAYQECMFDLQVHILLYILDYPEIGKVLKLSGFGAYKGCVWCDIDGKHAC